MVRSVSNGRCHKMQERFAVIEDPRQQGDVKHKLCDILTMVMCAVICGLDELGTVVTYIRNRATFFKENFGIASVPSKATFSRVLRMIDGEKVAKIMVNIMKEQLGERGEVLAVDGKAASFWDRKRFMKKQMKFPSFRKCWTI